MKILKKPKFLPCECSLCGAVFLPKKEDMRTLTAITQAPYTRCPFCGNEVVVKFKKDGAEK